MSKSKQSIIFLNYFSTGILIPVLNLILLERGADLKTIPLLLALYAVSALCFELPSGVCADIYGRKTAFLISQITKVISLVFLISAEGVGLLAICVVFNGISRAFSSGSLDALIIEQAVELEGEAYLPKVTSRLAILQAAGFAAGSILGGFISYAEGTVGVILVQGGLTAVIFVLCLLCIKEAPKREGHKERTPLLVHLKRAKEVILSAEDLKYVLFGMFFTGFLLVSIETYWQPVYMEVSAFDNGTWTLGIISFLGFLMVASGNAASERLLLRFKGRPWKVYGICRLILGGFLIFLSMQTTGLLFIVGYGGIYLFLGTGDVVENTLMNRYTPNHVRASILSLSSFIFQTGSFSASLLSSLVVASINIRGIWILSGILLICYFIIIFFLLVYKNTNKIIIE